MLFISLSGVVVLGTIVLSVFHLRALRGALSPDTPATTLRLKRIALADRLQAAVEMLPSGTWEKRFAEELISAPSPELKAAATNESLGDLALLFSSRSRWAPSAIRICLLGGLLFGALALIRGQRVEAIVSVVLCALGAGVCAWVAGRARASESAQRKIADQLAQVLVPDAPRAESVGRRFRNVL